MRRWRTRRNAVLTAAAASALVCAGCTVAAEPPADSPSALASETNPPAVSPQSSLITSAEKGTFTLAANPAWNIVHESAPAVRVGGKDVSRDCVALGADKWTGPPAPPAAEPAVQGQVAVVGDSLILFDEGLKRSLQAAGWSGTIDAVAGRYVYDAVKPLRKLAASGGLPDTVVIALGTNGKTCPASIRKQQISNVLSAIGPDRDVIWVNAAWATHASDVDPSTFNDLLADAAAGNPRLTIIDWAAKARELDDARGDIYDQDGIHLQPWVYEFREAEIRDALAQQAS